LLHAGYVDVGMDHFALPSDSLATAFMNGKLHRNFMGYTINETDLLIGLGVSSISDAKYAYAQNEKKVENYIACLSRDDDAIVKGHIHTAEDLGRRSAILEIVCNGTLAIKNHAEIIRQNIATVKAMVEEGIIDFTSDHIRVTDKGRPFIRNIAAVFDGRMKISSSITPRRYSNAI
jgi:oxygen-independent coproporphyrinogen III oxidase